MNGQIDPAADSLWESVAFISTAAGSQDRHPRTDAEWQTLRASAVNLIEAGNLLRMPGRRAAPAGTAAPGELQPAEIERRIDASHESFVQLVRVLQQAGTKALVAIDAKDPQALMDAGSVIDEACEACHVTYWYPNQQRSGS